MQTTLRVLAVTRKAGPRTIAPTWRLRVACLIPELHRLGIQVDTLELPHGGRAERRALAARRGYDFVWLHRHITWPWKLAHIRAAARHLVFDFDDPVCFSPRGGRSLTRWWKFRATVTASDLVLAASPRLVELATSIRREAHLVPLAVEPSNFTMKPSRRQPGEPLLLLWLGSASTFPYLLGARPALEAIGRACPEARLVLVGGGPLILDHLPVRQWPWTPQAQAEELARCHIGLAPMPATPWAEGKATLKPLQYLASGMPLVGSPVGINRHLAAANVGLVADAPDQWARAITRLGRDEAARQKMGWRGVRHIAEKHSPAVLAATVAEHFRQLELKGVSQLETRARRETYSLAASSRTSSET